MVGTSKVPYLQIAKISSRPTDLYIYELKTWLHYKINFKYTIYFQIAFVLQNICVDTLKISEDENDTGRAFRNFVKSEDIADAVEFLIKTPYHVQACKSAIIKFTDKKPTKNKKPIRPTYSISI